MSNAFQTNLRAEDLINGKRKLLDQLVFKYGRRSFVVQAGFETDGTSVPWFLGWWVNPWKAPFSRASVLHDCFYYFGRYSRLFSDLVYYAALLSEARIYIQARTPVGTLLGGVMKKTAWLYCYGSAILIFTGVRCFGWYPWLQHRKRENA